MNTNRSIFVFWKNVTLSLQEILWQLICRWSGTTNFSTRWAVKTFKAGLTYCFIGIDADSIHQLDRAAQVITFRLRTGHCPLLSHLHRHKISDLDKCTCGTGPQTPNCICQSCSTFDTEMPDMAQSSGCPYEAQGDQRGTSGDCGLCPVYQTENLVWPGMQKKKKKKGNSSDRRQISFKKWICNKAYIRT